MTRSLSCLCWMALLAAVAVFEPQTTAHAQPGQIARRETGDRVTFDFPGGTLRDYIELVKKTWNADLQVILAAEVEDVKMEPVQFKQVNVPTVLGVIPEIVHGRVNVTPFRPSGGEQNIIWRISPPPYTTRVFSVRHFITKESGGSQERAAEPEQRERAMKQLISAIEAALDVGSHSTPDVKIKLHPDTGLLLVAGTREQVEIIDQVVSHIDDSQHVTGQTVQDLHARIKALERELRNLRTELGQQHPNGSPSGD